MKDKFKRYFMKIAFETAKLSYAKRLKVGAIIVKDNRIISIGYNGQPAGWDNNCEKMIKGTAHGGKIDFEDYEKMYPYTNGVGDRYKLETLQSVVHAEENALGKLAGSNESGQDATLFITHSPCIFCAKMIHVSGIETVYYATQYRSNDGIEFLRKCKVNVVHYKL